MKNLNEYLKNFSEENKTLMVIYPHPDDETMGAGGLLLNAKNHGWKTVVVVLTHGEAGQIHIAGNGKTLAQIRNEELRRAVELLKVDHLHHDVFPDGKLRSTVEKWQPVVKKLIEKHDPAVVVTYDKSGVTGHPDHIILSQRITQILSLEKKKRKLFWNTGHGMYRRFVRSDVLPLMMDPTHKLDIQRSVFRKWRAAKSHKSQALGKGLPVPLFLAFLLFAQEWYYEVDLGRKFEYKFVDFKI